MVVDLIIAITLSLVLIQLLNSPTFTLWILLFLPIIIVCWSFIGIGYIFVVSLYFITLIIIAITTAIIIEPVIFILSSLVSIAKP